MMKVQLISIQKTANPRLYNIEVLIEKLRQQFTITVESFTVANQEIQVTNGDESFSETFRFNQIIASDICQLVAKFHNHQNVNLPIEIGDFYADKLELMKV